MDRSTIALVNFCRTTLAWVGVLPALIVIVGRRSQRRHPQVAVTKTVPLVMLLNELNRLKMTSGIKDAEAARHLGCQPSKINRIMLG